MDTSLHTLVIPLLSSIALLLTCTMANTAQSLGITTSFSYNFSGHKPADLTYQGDAHFPSDTAVLRLTKTNDSGNPQPYSVGRVIYSKPVILSHNNKQADFKTTVKFIINPDNGDNQYHPANGLVFFISPINYTIGDNGANFGVFDDTGNMSNVLAVEFDVYYNEDFDPIARHVGIDIESRISKNVTMVYSDKLIGQEVSALIAYDGTTKLISVHGSVGSKKFEVSYVVDLSTILPQHFQVGISAATGRSVAVHDVFSWSFDSAFTHIK